MAHAAKTRGRKTVSPKHAAFPLNRRRKPALFYGEKRPVMSRGSAKFCASCVKSASILSAETDTGHERGLGDLLQLRITDHLYDEGKWRTLYAGVFTHTYQCRISSHPIIAHRHSGTTPMRSAFAMFGISNVFVSRPRMKINTGFRILPVPTGWKRCTSPCDFKDDFISQFLSPK